MNQFINIGDEGWQQTGMTLADGTTLILDLRYRPAVQRWFFGISHPRLALSGTMLALHPNLLRPWRNRIAFGLACLAADGADPVDVTDFASGRVQLYALDAAEVAQVETDIIGGSA